MTKTERALLLATAGVLVVGAGAWLLVRKPGGRQAAGPDGTDPRSGASVVIPTPAAPPEVGRDPSDPGRLGGTAAPGASGGAVPPGLRMPSGDDLSDPARVKSLLRAHLKEGNPRWDAIAQLLGVLSEPLDDDVKNALLHALVYGNAAGAVQAYERVRDGTVVADLLRVLDDPKIDAHDRNNVLVALSSVPGADLKETVTGIESRLTADFEHDLPYLQAISRMGGAEAARALADAILTSREPARFGLDVWRSFDFRKDPAAADHLASVLRGPVADPKALAALAELSGRPGASPALVEALSSLDADAQPQPVRVAALGALARTGDVGAIERLIAVAEKGADYASVAAAAIGDTTTLSVPARTRLLEVAKATRDDHLRENIVEAFGAARAVEAVPLLTELLSTGSDLVRKQAARALGRIGPRAESAVDALLASYGGGDEAMRQHVALAVGAIGTPEARKAVEQMRASERSEKVKRTLDGVYRQFTKNDPR